MVSTTKFYLAVVNFKKDDEKMFVNYTVKYRTYWRQFFFIPKTCQTDFRTCPLNISNFTNGDLKLFLQLLI